MYRSVKALHGAAIEAVDGGSGCEEQVYFDDVTWAIRFLVVDIGMKADAGSVLISPRAIAAADVPRGIIYLNLTRRQIASSPEADTNRPVSCQKEIELGRYYSYPLYSGGAGPWHQVTMPGMLLAAALAERDAADYARNDDPHLRSSREVIGYRAVARDGRAGRVADLLFDDSSWTIAFAVIERKHRFGGGRALVPARRLGPVSWSERRLNIDLPLAAIREAPSVDSLDLVTLARDAESGGSYKLVSSGN